MFRTADAAGVTKIILSGYTPTPIDRFGRPVKELSKTALGGELSVEWEQITDPVSYIIELKRFGDRENRLNVIGIEQDSRSVDYKTVSVQPDESVLFIVGNEVEGMSPELMKLCDSIAEIPMNGQKESLNVAVSCGIALFRILNI